MKDKGLLITTIIFFLLVNTTYYWEGELGIFAIPVFLILAVVFIGLGVALFRQLYFAIKERFNNKWRFVTIGFVATVMCLTLLKPFELINFDRIEGKDILVAQREGVANCMTTLKLKENNRFTERSVCFGVTKINGNYRLQNDTIYFDNVELNRHEKEFYKFAIIRPSKLKKDDNTFGLVRYRDFNDTTGNELWIIKNEL